MVVYSYRENNMSASCKKWKSNWKLTLIWSGSLTDHHAMVQDHCNFIPFVLLSFISRWSNVSQKKMKRMENAISWWWWWIYVKEKRTCAYVVRENWFFSALIRLKWDKIFMCIFEILFYDKLKESWMNLMSVVLSVITKTFGENSIEYVIYLIHGWCMVWTFIFSYFSI